MLNNLTHRELFLIDGVGALVSATFLGVLLVHLESYIGMPVDLLYLLAVTALVFSAYSLSCHFLSPANWRTFLKGIAILNAIYCCLTIGLVVNQYASLTLLGLSYFIAELILVAGLIRLEWMKSSNLNT